jgi:hypothetical protein
MAATKVEEYLATQLAPLLASGETIVASAYLLPILRRTGNLSQFVEAARARAAFVTLTSRRIIVIFTRVPAFGPLLENLGIHIVDRAQLTGARVTRELELFFADGTTMTFRVERTAKHIGSQPAFFDILQRDFGAGAPPVPPRSPWAIAGKVAFYAAVFGGAIAYHYMTR